MRTRPVLLDAFCGAGGASWGYVQAGFSVIGVDHLPQDNYPFDFIKADALEYIAEHGHRYDVIHASPPCKAHTVLAKRQVGKTYVSLIAPTRAILRTAGKPYVIENVPGAPLQEPIVVCGSKFPPYAVRRHRWFESPIALRGSGCDHKRQTPRFPPNRSGRTQPAAVVSVVGTGAGRCGGYSAELGRWAMGIWWMNKGELSQAIPPAYTRFVGRQLLEVL